MLYYRPWEILIGVVETAAEADVLLVGVILGVKTDLCLEPPAVIAEMNVQCLLGQQAVNRFTAVTVLKEWETVGRIRRDLKGLVSELQTTTRITTSLER